LIAEHIHDLSPLKWLLPSNTGNLTFNCWHKIDMNQENELF